MPHPIDELLDLVDANDNVIGQKPRSQVYSEQLSNFRAINVFIVNSRGELWIPRRTAHKKMFPLGLDMSTGGHVESGEDYDTAFRREVMEELNIDIDRVDHRLIGYCTPHQHGTAAFSKIYEIRSDETPVYNPDDFVEAFWITPQELLERIEQGEVAKGDLPILVKMLYSQG